MIFIAGYDISLVLISSVDSAVSEWNIEESTSGQYIPLPSYTKNLSNILSFLYRFSDAFLAR